MNRASSQEKDVALQCAFEAGRLIAKIRQETLSAEAITKADRSPVTLADYGAQAVVCRILKDAFPEDVIVAEEKSELLRDPGNAELLAKLAGFVRQIFADATEAALCQWVDYGAKATASRYWCLDPIDGTKGFLRGDQYALALALVENGVVQLGVLACPNLPAALNDPERARGVVFMAARGEGAYQMGAGSSDATPIHVTARERTAGIRFCESVESDHSDHRAHIAVSERLGIRQPPIRMDSQAKYGIVARGDASIYLRLPHPGSPEYREKVWDHAAGAILVEEAGGRVTDIHGKPLDFGKGFLLTDNTGVIATNGRLHDEVLAALQEEREGFRDRSKWGIRH
jgi:3'(2'), 5'-bisphosphate nucleotidase